MLRWVESLHPDARSRQASRAAGVGQLAAWTVTKQTDGDIHVTIRDLRDAAGLQAALRADGVPAKVHAAASGLHVACHPYPSSSALLEASVQVHPAAAPC
jgi:hypothetical protein